MQHQDIQFLAILLTAFIKIGYARAPAKIIDGEVASILDFPYQVFMMAPVTGGFTGCGGTILDNRHILTAAHCCYDGHSLRLIRPQAFTVITGTDDLQYKPTENLFGVLKVTPHPDFHRTGLVENDIAILKLNRSILFNDYRKPAVLPTTYPPVTAEVMVTGWGSRKINHTGPPDPYLQKLKINVITAMECFLRRWKVVPWKIQFTQICTSSEARGSVCRGDSGGPLSYNGTVIGVASMGKCGNNYPTIFTAVFSYVPWIRSIQAQADP